MMQYLRVFQLKTLYVSNRLSLQIMNTFTIESNPPFLIPNIQAYYNTDFLGYGNPNNPNYLNTLKNPNYLNTFKDDNHQAWWDSKLVNAVNQLRNVLSVDLPQILQLLSLNPLTACVVPRAKADDTYPANQRLFKSTVRAIVNELDGFDDGTDYISRHTNTKITHLRKPIEGFVNDGQMPYRGITTDTCNISNNVNGKNILLIDDIYTKTINIDEDALQALLDNGAKSVALYVVGKTVDRSKP